MEAGDTVSMLQDTELINKFNKIAAAVGKLCNIEIPKFELVRIHNLLLEYTSLSRTTEPVTFGDYMTGIATCARHLNNPSADYLPSESNKLTLDEIYEYLDNAGKQSVEREEYTDWCDCTNAGHICDGTLTWYSDDTTVTCGKCGCIWAVSGSNRTLYEGCSSQEICPSCEQPITGSLSQHLYNTHGQVYCDQCSQYYTVGQISWDVPDAEGNCPEGHRVFV